MGPEKGTMEFLEGGLTQDRQLYLVLKDSYLKKQI